MTEPRTPHRREPQHADVSAAAAEECEVIKQYSRWPGLTLLTFNGLVPWLAVLWAQLTAYMAVPWVCARGGSTVIALHAAAIVHLAITLACIVVAMRDWRRTGGGFEEERDTVMSRTRFAALWALGSSMFCSLVILAIWLPVFIFNPCMRP